MSEFDFSPERFYSAQEHQLVADFKNLGAYNARTIEEVSPDGALAMQEILLNPFGYSGECTEVATLLQSQMVKSFGVESRLDTADDDDNLNPEATVFTFSDVVVDIRRVETHNGNRYFMSKYPTPTDKNAKFTGQIKSCTVINQEEYDNVLYRYREGEAKRYLSENLGINKDTLTNLEISLEDMQAMAKSFAEISRLEVHDPTKLPEMPNIDKKRKKALRSLKQASYIGLLFGDDINDEAVDDYTEYIEGCSVGVTDEVYEHILRLEQAKRLKVLQDRVERRIKTADIGHAVKTVGLTALMGATGYASGLVYDSKMQTGEIIEHGLQSDSAWKVGVTFGAIQLVRSLSTVRKYMRNRSLIKARPMTKNPSDIELTIAGQMHQEAVAFSASMRLSKVQHTI